MGQDDEAARPLVRLAAETQAVYERNAARFDAARPKGLFERPWLDRFLADLPPGGRLLDLGCGSGEPIAAYLIDRGHRVTGLDASPAMLALARAKRPDGDWRLCDMRGLDLPERFNGILGWDSFFHLTRPEQRDLLPRLAAHLRPGGKLMLTVGPAEGEVGGRVGDDAVYHASLSPVAYREILAANGLTVENFVIDDPDCDRHTVLLARKAAPAAARIRLLRDQDVPALVRLFHDAVQEIGSRDYTAEQVAAWSPAPPDPAAFLARVRDGRQVYVAVDADDEPLGFIELEADGRIDCFYCRPDVAGSGVGAALYAHLEDTAVAQGFDALNVEASEAARRFFERRGFALLHRRDFQRRGVALHNYKMAKRLAGN